MIKENDAVSFIVNNGLNLPGRIHLILTEAIINEGKYVYLFHKGRQKYELLNTEIKQGQFEIDIAGNYKITEKKMISFYWNSLIIVIVALCIIGGTIVYICVAKKYWFW